MTDEHPKPVTEEMIERVRAIRDMLHRTAGRCDKADIAASWNDDADALNALLAERNTTYALIANWMLNLSKSLEGGSFNQLQFAAREIHSQNEWLLARMQVAVAATEAKP